jgi:hypothetical protein
MYCQFVNSKSTDASARMYASSFRRFAIQFKQAANDNGFQTSTLIKRGYFLQLRAQGRRSSKKQHTHTLCADPLPGGSTSAM